MSEKTSTHNDESWIPAREALVQCALDTHDYEALRRISALPGGFGRDETRSKVWPVLLRTAQYFPSAGEPSEPAARRDNHRDEAQVKLDTDRSFVSYPRNVSAAEKQAMQDDLKDLIVGTLRRFPQLNYFQGYHDIMAVLYLTLVARPAVPSGERRPDSPRIPQGPPAQAQTAVVNDHSPPSEERDTVEWHTLRNCAAAVSIFHIRDAMGKGMDGMMGWLKLLKRILRASDPDLARFSNVISPVPTLPFFALSWILCLFSHDIDTLEPVQRMFDYLLARSPVAALYLAVAILVIKKPQMYALARKLGSEAMDDPSLLHPLFARLPPLFADTPTVRDDGVRQPSREKKTPQDDPNPYTPIALSELFALTDTLMAKYPWDGKRLHGQDIFGQGSVLNTYELGETADKSWDVQSALRAIDCDVVKPGATEVDPEDEQAVDASPLKPFRRLMLPRTRLRVLFAFGVLLVGIGIAAYRPESGALRSGKAGLFWVRGWLRHLQRSVIRGLAEL